MQESSGIPNFESGTIILATGNVSAIKVNLTRTHINIDVEDKAFIKRIISMREQLSPQPSKSQGEDQTPNVGGALSMIKSVAETLCSRGITITVTFKGKRIVTIGADAHPILLHHITKTRGLAINSIITAIRMII